MRVVPRRRSASPTRCSIPLVGGTTATDIADRPRRDARQRAGDPQRTTLMKLLDGCRRCGTTSTARCRGTRRSRCRRTRSMRCSAYMLHLGDIVRGRLRAVRPQHRREPKHACPTATARLRSAASGRSAARRTSRTRLHEGLPGRGQARGIAARRRAQCARQPRRAGAAVRARRAAPTRRRRHAPSRFGALHSPAERTCMDPRSRRSAVLAQGSRLAMLRPAGVPTPRQARAAEADAASTRRRSADAVKALGGRRAGEQGRRSSRARHRRERRRRAGRRTSKLPKTQEHRVLVEKNPNTLAAVSTSPTASSPACPTRVKMGQT